MFSTRVSHEKTQMKPNLRMVCWLYCPIKTVLHFLNDIKYSPRCHLSQEHSSKYPVKIKCVMIPLSNTCVQYRRMVLQRKAHFNIILDFLNFYLDKWPHSSWKHLSCTEKHFPAVELVSRLK